MTKAITKPPRRRAGVNMAAALGCLLAAVMADRSVAFVVGGGTPGAFAGCGGRAGGTARMISSSALSPSSFSGAAAVANDALRRQSSRSRRGAALRMEIMSNPITSKQYGKADKGGGKKGNPDVNEEITVETVRCVISVKGMDEQLGIMSTSEALDRAQELGLDLVMISPDADPPVVKIIDYGKFKYKSDKRKKDSKAKAKATEMKEVKMSYKIEQHDYGVRVKNVKKFVAQGNRVRVVVQFRGREQSHMDLGTVLLDKVVKDMDGLANAEPKRREGNRLSMILFPKTLA